MSIINDDKLEELAKEAYMEYWCNDDSEWDDGAKCLWMAITNNLIVSIDQHRVSQLNKFEEENGL